MSLTALVYLSFAQGKHISQDELTSILEQARRNNQKRNITGLLLYRNGLFIQALEGAEKDVTAIFDVIRHDERHQNILVLYKNPIKRRSFEDWAMGFHVIDDEDLKQVEGFSDFLEKPLDMDYLQSNPQHVQTLLNTFRAM